MQNCDTKMHQHLESKTLFYILVISFMDNCLFGTIAIAPYT